MGIHPPGGTLSTSLVPIAAVSLGDGSVGAFFTDSEVGGFVVVFFSAWSLAPLPDGMTPGLELGLGGAESHWRPAYPPPSTIETAKRHANKVGIYRST
jgi:hypothetical protein